MDYRVENKYLVSDADLAVLEGRLKTVMEPDEHQNGSCYEIRSVYFDDILDMFMMENDAGLDCRSKYRIRIYAPSAEVIHLEIKEKSSGLTKKISCSLTREECERILEGTMPLQFDCRAPLNKLLLQMRCTKMEPKAIIAYERTAYVHPTGNVRITFDRNIMASRCWGDFFEERISGMTPILPSGMHILEVKYDELLPDYIAQQLQIGSLRQTAFSKYYLGRLSLCGEFPV